MAGDLMRTLVRVSPFVLPLRQARSLPPTAQTFPSLHFNEAPVLYCVCELEAALAESKADLDAGRFVKETVAQHMRRIAKINKAA
jgi:hypothetical protein